MDMKSGLCSRARQISMQDRMAKLMSFKEKDFHKCLERLFSEMDKEAVVRVTHSSTELGADLVVIRKDRFRESVAAVVVSMGHIRGDTGKQIERITSQIKQCFDMPREVPTRLDAATTSEVWLANVGDISQGARKRLNYQVKQEYKSVLTIHDIEWLAENFTEYYPEVFLGGDVLNFIEERIEALEMTNSLAKRASNLSMSEWYVEPFLLTGRIPIEVDEEGTKISIGSHKVHFHNLKSIIEKERLIIVSGDAGVGKTTALSKLVLDELREVSEKIVGGRAEERVAVPVIMSAREILGCEDCESFLRKCTEKKQLASGFEISTLILDGLDEVSLEYRREALEKAKGICVDMGWKLIVGSRKIDVIKNPPEGLSTFELLPFEVSQAIKLFKKIVPKSSLLDALKEGLPKVISQLPMTPISLTILIEIAEEHGEVPASLADLYSRYFEMVLGKWDFRDKDIKSLFQYETKLHFLAEFAWTEFVQKNVVEITKEEFESFVEEHVEKFGFDSDRTNEFIAEIERAGLIEIKDMVSFKHRSFLDYFASLYLFNHQDEFANMEELNTQLYFSDLWTDVTFYFVGIKRAMSSKLLETIMDYPGEDMGTKIGKYVVGRLLQAGWLTPVELKYTGLKSCLKLLVPIRDKLAESFSDERKGPGMIFADFLPIATAEWTMGSTTLAEAVRRIYVENKGEKSQVSHWYRMASIWALWRFMSVEEREECISELMASMSASNELSVEEKSRIMLLMIVREEKAKYIRGAVDRRLRAVIKKHPAIIKRLLPPQKTEGLGRRRRGRPFRNRYGRIE